VKTSALLTGLFHHSDQKLWGSDGGRRSLPPDSDDLPGRRGLEATGC
jgi:hypothetical protein